MKTARLTLLTTPEFKAYLGAEAARGGISVAELVRTRCEQKPAADEAMLAALASELRKAVRDARASLRSGIEEAGAVLSELRARRRAAQIAISPSRSPPKRGRVAAANET